MADDPFSSIKKVLDQNRDFAERSSRELFGKYKVVTGAGGVSPKSDDTSVPGLTFEVKTFHSIEEAKSLANSISKNGKDVAVVDRETDQVVYRPSQKPCSSLEPR